MVFTSYKYILQGKQAFSLYRTGGGRHSNMKLVVLLSIAALVACDYSAPPKETSGTFTTPEKIENIHENIGSIEPGNSFFKFNSIYRGAFPPAHFPPTNFFSSPSTHTFGNSYKAFNLAASPQGILPPISQIIPPQISQIVPPIFGNVKPVLPTPSPVVPPVVPPQVFPPVTNPLLNRFNVPYYSPLYQFPYTFPSTFSFPPSTFFPSQIQKQPSKTQTETLSASYGPPVAEPEEPEPAGPAESSAPFEPSPVSFPYEPAAPEAPEPSAPHKPAQEYGIPSLN